MDANVLLGFEADQRSYTFCAEILKHFGVSRVRLMSNNPDKILGLETEGIEVVERVPLVIKTASNAAKYLKTKKEKLGHILE